TAIPRHHGGRAPLHGDPRRRLCDRLGPARAMTGAAPVWAPYCGPGPGPGEWLARWNGDPLLLAALALGLGLTLARISGRERTAGLGALAVLAVIFVSPLCALSSSLFAARTVHHVLLVAVAAPLIARTLPRRS